MGSNRDIVERMRTSNLTTNFVNNLQLKTVNNQSIIGTGNINITASIPSSLSLTDITLTNGGGVGKILTSDENGLASWQNLTLPTSPTFNSVKLTTGAGAGKVLTSDASGNATWQTAYSYTLPSSISLTGLTITGGSPGAGKVLTSDASGNATWQTAPTYTLPSSISLTGLTTTNATVTSLVTTNLQIIGGTPAAGEVLTSDAVGNASWQPIAIPDQMIYIQDTEPVVAAGKSALWIQTFPDGSFTFNIVQN